MNTGLAIGGGLLGGFLLAGEKRSVSTLVHFLHICCAFNKLPLLYMCQTSWTEGLTTAETEEEMEGGRNTSIPVTHCI